MVHHHHRPGRSLVIVDFLVLRVGDALWQHHLRRFVSLSYEQLSFERLLSELLQTEVDRELDVVAGLRLNTLENALDATDGVDFIAHETRNSAQVDFIGQLNAVQTNAFVGVVSQ